VYPEVAELATERAMAYLRTRLSGEELERYEGYYMVFRDYGADEGMRHYKSFLIMQRFVAENLPPLNSTVLEREQVERFHIVARPYEIKTRNKGVHGC
jgi:hypothetical protein